MLDQKRLRISLPLLLLGLTQPGAVRAQPEPPREPVPIAVLDVQARGAFDAERVAGVSNLLVVEASRRPGLSVSSSSDVRALLGFEAERQLLDCGEDSGCMAELAGALGVDYVVNTEVSRVGELWIVSLHLLDLKTARAVRRASRRTKDESQLVDEAISALDEVLAPLGGSRAAPAGRGRGWFAWAVTGTGAAATVAGAALLGSAWQTRLAWDADPLSVRPEAAYSAQNVSAPVGVGLMVGGAALMAASLLIPRPSPKSPRVAVTAGPGLVAGALVIPLE